MHPLGKRCKLCSCLYKRILKHSLYLLEDKLEFPMPSISMELVASHCELFYHYREINTFAFPSYAILLFNTQQLLSPPNTLLEQQQFIHADGNYAYYSLACLLPVCIVLLPYVMPDVSFICSGTISAAISFILLPPK